MLTFGIVKCFLFIFLFSSLKSEKYHTVPYFIGIIKVGAAHWKLVVVFNTPILINLSTSFLMVGLLIFCKGKSLP